MNKTQFIETIFKDCYAIDTTYITSTISARYVPVLFSERSKKWILDEKRTPIHQNPHFFKGTIVGILARNEAQLTTFCNIFKSSFLKSLKIDDEYENSLYNLDGTY